MSNNRYYPRQKQYYTNRRLYRQIETLVNKWEKLKNLDPSIKNRKGSKIAYFINESVYNFGRKVTPECDAYAFFVNTPQFKEMYDGYLENMNKNLGVELTRKKEKEEQEDK